MQVDLKYNSIEARRFNKAEAHVSVKNNNTIKSVSLQDNKIVLDFIFTSTFEPNVGEIRIEGAVQMSDSEDNMKKIVDEWEKSGKKNIPVEIAEDIHNIIISNCIVETVILAREINLPLPIPLPRVVMGTKKEEKEDTIRETESYIR